MQEQTTTRGIRMKNNSLLLALAVSSPADNPVPSKTELKAMSRYRSPVNPAVFPHLTMVLLATGTLSAT
ncbi:Transmembrane protein 258 [Camelus dromedarius]|uniref:Transmembrane protein 258 n=1 Tax=Camelus dromedarius TaxID=9838 RepID=A0A5N4CTN8_CAMDR|nr:Transmembrane protein 258 [Camelus dromedarius]